MYIYWWLIAFILFALTLYIKHHRYRNSFIRMGLPSVELGFFDIFGHITFLPRGSLYKNLHIMLVYVFQMMCGYVELFKERNFSILWLAFKPVVFVGKAEVVEEVLISTAFFEKPFVYKAMEPAVGKGLLTSGSTKWKSRRRLLNHSFHSDILKVFFPIFNEQCQVLVDILKQETQKEWIDMVYPIKYCTLDIICETAMGVVIGAQRNPNQEYVQLFDRAAIAIMDRVCNPLLWLDFFYYKSSFGRKFKKDCDAFHGITKDIIRRRKLLWSPTENSSIHSNRKALLDLLLDHHMIHGDINEEGIQEEVDIFIVAGHDTTATSTTWVLYLIGLHPKIQKIIHEELDSLFHGSDEEITMDHLNQMRYLDCVIKESLRLFPAIPLVARQAKEGMTIGGCKIPDNSMLVVLIYMLHRDPDVFPNPEVFDPDRFLPEATIGRHPFAYIPFSGGPRNCIGQRFGMMEMKTILASVLRCFEVQTLEPRDKIALVPTLTLHNTGPIRMKVSLRESK